MSAKYRSLPVTHQAVLLCERMGWSIATVTEMPLRTIDKLLEWLWDLDMARGIVTKD